LAIAFVAIWFQPQKLFIDDKVNEALPTASSSPTSPGRGETTSSTPPPPIDLATGTFTSLDHTTSGTVRVVELADGTRVVRLEDFETENGPDLFVYLSTTEVGGSEQSFDDDFVNLGRLKGNIGNQNYVVPREVDLGKYASVVIWCDRFDSGFGVAPV